MIDVDVTLYCDECDTRIYDDSEIYCKNCFEGITENSEMAIENETLKELLKENNIEIPIKMKPVYLCPALPKILNQMGINL